MKTFSKQNKSGANILLTNSKKAKSRPYYINHSIFENNSNTTLYDNIYFSPHGKHNINTNKVIPIVENRKESALLEEIAKNQFKNKQYYNALQTIEKSLYNAPKNYKAHENLACILLAKGYKHEAFDIYRNAQNKKKKHPRQFYIKHSNTKNNTYSKQLETTGKKTPANELVHNFIDNKSNKENQLLNNILKFVSICILLGIFILLPSFAKAQEPSAPWVPFNLYNQPNNQEVIGKNKLEWYGSGDVNNDETINYQDYIDLESMPSDRSDVDGDGTPSTANDKIILQEFLDGDRNYLPGHRNKLVSREEKIDWLEKCLAIDQTDTISYDPTNFNCAQFSLNLFANFSGIANFENYDYFYKSD